MPLRIRVLAEPKAFIRTSLRSFQQLSRDRGSSLAWAMAIKFISVGMCVRVCVCVSMCVSQWVVGLCSTLVNKGWTVQPSTHQMHLWQHPANSEEVQEIVGCRLIHKTSDPSTG